MNLAERVEQNQRASQEELDRIANTVRTAVRETAAPLLPDDDDDEAPCSGVPVEVQVVGTDMFGGRTTVRVYENGRAEICREPYVPATPEELVRLAVARAKLDGIVGRRFTVPTDLGWRVAVRALRAYLVGRRLRGRRIV